MFTQNLERSATFYRERASYNNPPISLKQNIQHFWPRESLLPATPMPYSFGYLPEVFAHEMNFALVATIFLELLLSLRMVAAKHRIKNGNGTIAIEEAWTIPELLPFQLQHLLNHRAFQMVLSCATPCVQGVSDPVAAAALAVNVNNQMAAAIRNDTTRFGGFASLSMHNATEAVQELRRAVNELGLLGAMLNDFQQSGPDNTTLLYYDQPEYDEFWQAVTELDVPIYFHPRSNIAQVQALLFDHAPFLKGAPEEYAVTLANHILGLCTNGVFDRFPNLKIIVGHLGERIPSDLFRIDERRETFFITVSSSRIRYVKSPELAKSRPNGLMMQRNITSYWHTNIYETTSGNFATPLLEFHMGQIGIDRILFSVDYPFVRFSFSTLDSGVILPYELSDSKCIVLQKPPGLLCQLSKPQEAAGNSFNDFNVLLKGLWKTFNEQPVPVHRLDKVGEEELLCESRLIQYRIDQGTTGALVLGRSSIHARNLAQQFRARTVDKTYLALVRGGAKTFPTKSGQIRTPIKYEDGRASIDRSSNGKPSVTDWEVVSSSPSAPLTLLRLKLHTGHKHQLRVHLAYCLGAPILGDDLYSSKSVAKAIRDTSVVPADRMFLHASHVSFFSTGPKKRLRLGITAPLPSDFVKICMDSGINIDPTEARGGVWVDNIRIKDGLVPELEGAWRAGRSG
ncbi:hypothetical protein C0992_012250 [Termitomyces sp. T32_za158]|nr:hypothetical protein C0992_012250 [Termitomyces sp. T32_za158]